MASIPHPTPHPRTPPLQPQQPLVECFCASLHCFLRLYVVLDHPGPSRARLRHALSHCTPLREPLTPHVCKPYVYGTAGSVACLVQVDLELCGARVGMRVERNEVMAVHADSAAARAGLHAGDVVDAVDGLPCESLASALASALGSRSVIAGRKAAPSTLVLRVRRGVGPLTAVAAIAGIPSPALTTLTKFRFV